MKVCGQERMEVTLPVYGRERTFSEQELIDILEKYFVSEVTEQPNMTGDEQKLTESPDFEVKLQFAEQTKTTKVAQKPVLEKYFEVRPQNIDKGSFKEKRIDSKQEKTRCLIIKALNELKKNPEKYGRNFKTMMPKKIWETKTIQELKDMTAELGGHMADWVEQVLEWAQRIENGETWESVCNEADTANWYRSLFK